MFQFIVEPKCAFILSSLSPLRHNLAHRYGDVSTSIRYDDLLLTVLPCCDYMLTDMGRCEPSLSTKYIEDNILKHFRIKFRNYEYLIISAYRLFPNGGHNLCNSFSQRI